MNDYSISGVNQPDGLTGVSPILLLGILVFVLPYFNGVLKWSLPGWISGIGIVLIIAGSIHSAMRMM